MSPPWMPLGVDDYLADTRHLSTLEHGAYLLLIMRYWQKSGLPDDERMIMRIAGMTQDQWEESRDVLASFFSDGWRHPRIDVELAKADEIISKRKSAAKSMHASRSACAEQVQSACSDTRVPHSPLQEPIEEIEYPPSEGPFPKSADKIGLAVAAYNETAQEAGWPIAQKLTAQRRNALRLRLSECGGIDGWREAMARARASPFLTGDNDRGWRAGFDFFLQAKSFTKLMEGSYDRREGASQHCGQERRTSGADQRFAAMAAVLSRRPDSRFSASAPGAFGLDGDTAQNGAGDVLPFGRPSGAGGGR